MFHSPTIIKSQIALFRSRNWQSVFCLFYTSMLYNSGNEKKHKQQQLNPFFFFLFSFFPRSFNRHLLLKGSETWTNKNQLLTHPYHDSVFSAEQCKYPFEHRSTCSLICSICLPIQTALTEFLASTSHLPRVIQRSLLLFLKASS